MSSQTHEATVVGGLPTLPRVNLLPPELHVRRKLRRVQMQLAAACLAAILVVVALYVSAMSSTNAANKDLEVAVLAHQKVQSQVDAEQPVKDTFALVDQTHVLLGGAGGHEVLWSTYLADLGPRLPKKAWLTSVKVTAAAPTAAGATAAPGIASIAIEGVALSHVNVATWLDSIAREYGWTSVYFSKSDELVINGVICYAFSSTLSVTAAAYSGRYTKLAGG